MEPVIRLGQAFLAARWCGPASRHVGLIAQPFAAQAVGSVLDQIYHVRTGEHRWPDASGSFYGFTCGAPRWERSAGDLIRRWSTSSPAERAKVPRSHRGNTNSLGPRGSSPCLAYGLWLGAYPERRPIYSASSAAPLAECAARSGSRLVLPLWER